MKHIIFFLFFIHFGFNQPANSNTSIHKKCTEAKDYEGCMQYQSNLSNKKNLLFETDCTKKLCRPEEVTQSTDNLGMKIIKGFYFKEDPVMRYAYYYDLDNLYRVNSKGEYGRFYHSRSVVRFYSKGFEGYTGITGGGITNCSTYGSSINCTTTNPIVTNIPSKAPGIRQNTIDHIYDCKDKTVAVYEDNKIKKWENKLGKKRKWHDWRDFRSPWTSSEKKLNVLKGICSGNYKSMQAANVSPSKFYLFEKKIPRK